MEDSINQRLEKIEQRLTRIEAKLSLPKQPEDQIQGTPPPPPSDNAPQASSHLAALQPAAQGSGNWLGLISVICFILAAAFIIKLAIDSGWLTPVRQIGLAYLLGATLVSTGLMLYYYDKEYASLLPAAGIIILYLTTFAAHQYYTLISFPTGIALTSLVSVMCIYLYWRLKHDIYAITAAIGTYLAPFLLGFETAAIFSLYYFVVCSLAFAALSIWMQSRILTLVAAYLAILVNTRIGLRLNQDELMAAILPLHFLIFVLATYFYTRHTKKYLTVQEAWIFFPVLILFYSMEYFFISQFAPQWAPWISLIFVALIFAVYLALSTWFEEGPIQSEPMIFAFVSLVLFHSIYLKLLPPELRTWLLVIIVLIFAAVPSDDYQESKLKRFFVPIAALVIIFFIEYVGLIYNLISLPVQLNMTLVSIATFASIWAYFFIKKDFIHKNQERGLIILTTAHLLAITALYQFTKLEGSLAVSVSWLGYAVAVMIIAYILKEKVMAQSALFVLSFAAGKALLYDAASAPTIVRIICLLITGIVLYGAGFMMRQIATWKDRP